MSILDNKDKEAINKMKGAGMTSAAIISILLIISPWEGSNVDRNGMHVAYVDTIGTGHPITYCSGLTGKDMYNKFPKAGDKYSQSECDYMLALRVKGFEEDVITSVIPNTSPLAKIDNRFASEFQKAAIVSFAYNVGMGNFRNSTLLRYLNSGNHGAACDQLVKWVYANGKKLKGLENRRNHEREFCMGAVDDKAKETLKYIEEQNNV